MCPVNGTTSEQARHAYLASLYLSQAVVWRERWRAAESAGAKAQCRRAMRLDAMSWRRKWADL